MIAIVAQRCATERHEVGRAAARLRLPGGQLEKAKGANRPTTRDRATALCGSNGPDGKYSSRK